MISVVITQPVITQKLQASLFTAKVWEIGDAVYYMWECARSRIMVPALMNEIT
jgi:hypothetical protein